MLIFRYFGCLSNKKVIFPSSVKWVLFNYFYGGCYDKKLIIDLLFAIVDWCFESLSKLSVVYRYDFEGGFVKLTFFSVLSVLIMLFMTLLTLPPFTNITLLSFLNLNSSSLFLLFFCNTKPLNKYYEPNFNCTKIY